MATHSNTTKQTEKAGHTKTAKQSTANQSTAKQSTVKQSTVKQSTVAKRSKTTKTTRAARQTRRVGRSAQEREVLLAQAKADFDARLSAIASDPAQWVTFIDQVAVFGAATASATNCGCRHRRSGGA